MHKTSISKLRMTFCVLFFLFFKIQYFRLKLKKCLWTPLRLISVKRQLQNFFMLILHKYFEIFSFVFIKKKNKVFYRNKNCDT